MSDRERQENFMRAALEEAYAAADIGEVPVGAVVVRGEEIIARAHNRVEAYASSSAHAEMLALDAAEASIGSKWLNDCDLYVTLEPCAMCAGAMILARLRGLYIGAMDPKNGAVGSALDVPGCGRLNHRLDIHTGILAEPCGEALSAFFRELRIRKSQIHKATEIGGPYP